MVFLYDTYVVQLQSVIHFLQVFFEYECPPIERNHMKSRKPMSLPNNMKEVESFVLRQDIIGYNL